MKCKKYLLGLITMGLVSACTDLDPEIYSNLTTANAYKTESDIEAAVVGLYAIFIDYAVSYFLVLILYQLIPKLISCISSPLESAFK